TLPAGLATPGISTSAGYLRSPVLLLFPTGKPCTPIISFPSAIHLAIFLCCAPTVANILYGSEISRLALRQKGCPIHLRYRPGQINTTWFFTTQLYYRTRLIILLYNPGLRLKLLI